MRKVGDTFFHGNLEYIVDEINADGTCNAHLIKVHKDEPSKPIATPTETPVKAVEDAEPIKVSDKPKRTYTRSNTTTRTRKTTTK